MGVTNDDAAADNDEFCTTTDGVYGGGGTPTNPPPPEPPPTGWHTGVSNSIMGDVTEVGLILRNSGIIVLSVLILRGVPLKDTDDDGVVLYDDADVVVGVPNNLACRLEGRPPPMADPRPLRS